VRSIARIPPMTCGTIKRRMKVAEYARRSAPRYSALRMRDRNDRFF
jgi:hypothetical protein